MIYQLQNLKQFVSDPVQLWDQPRRIVWGVPRFGKLSDQQDGREKCGVDFLGTGRICAMIKDCTDSDNLVHEIVLHVKETHNVLVL